MRVIVGEQRGDPANKRQYTRCPQKELERRVINQIHVWRDQKIEIHFLVLFYFFFNSNQLM